MKHLRILGAFLAISFGNAYAAEAATLPSMPAALVAKAQQYETAVRNQYEREVGHTPKTTHGLLEWLDRKTQSTKSLSDSEKDELVQSYGSVLGQQLIRELGGRWVLVPNEDNSPGVELPGGKVAFVFNRAGRRIFEGDSIGFVSYFEASSSYVHGIKLPDGVEANKR